MNNAMVRVKPEDLERIKQLSKKLGVSRGKCISKMLQIIETNPEAEELLITGDQLSEEILITEIKKTRRLLYRIIRTVCPLTEADANDPEFGITLTEFYEDKNRHPEKYRDE